MTARKLTYPQAQYFSSLMEDYLEQKEELRNLYHRFPNLENFEAQIKEKQAEFNLATNKRTVLTDVLLKQYHGLDNAQESIVNIELLRSDNTFTITTGHQLNLFTGPLYFLYKIVSVINLCKQLKAKYPTFDFVPVYWMATEDHDFEEIQYFKFQGKKLVWDREAAGGVGRLSNDGLDKVLHTLQSQLGTSDHAQEISQLFKKAYLESDNLAVATRFLAHQLFGNDGLVIVDGDDADLKSLVIPQFEEELLQQMSFHKVNETIEKWPSNYKVQVTPREINLFYLKDNLRERIFFEDAIYKVIDTDISFTKDEILTELHQHPERFSPNVIMRPLYQEAILPNLCYIGGGGEMAYWLELKAYFDSQNITFPMLLMRNSALLMSQKQLEKTEKLGLELQDLFLKDYQLDEKLTRQLSNIEIDFSSQKEHLSKQFKELYQIAQQTDQSFYGAVAAQERKQIKGLEYLEKRLLKAQKRKLKDFLDRALIIQRELFPNSSLQERQENFSSFYLEYGSQLITVIKQNLDPLDLRFTVIVFGD
ncbi:MAG: bacillithiol biosynthesis cysteine-adding enzyme BshC [Nonlabens sp.]|uniref:bacillithiol biosynthesis cysteine-adding enzyme BshC n=1 Tax=Nonlabens sp. TaxID=1888209 RepID=UPI003EF1FF7D